MYPSCSQADVWRWFNGADNVYPNAALIEPRLSLRLSSFHKNFLISHLRQPFLYDSQRMRAENNNKTKTIDDDSFLQMFHGHTEAKNNS